MNRIIRQLLLLLSFLMPLWAAAQSPAVKKAGQSVLVLTSFNKDGTIHTVSHAVLTGNTGEAIAMWHDLEGADHAIVIDSKGKQYSVDAMLGVSENYDVCRFRLKNYTNAATALSLVTSNAEQPSLYLIGYDLKSPSVKQLKPVRVEKFMTDYNYYVFRDEDVSGNQLGCPVVDAEGHLVGIMQRPAAGGQAFTADARLTTTFKLTGFSINDQTLRATGIRVALPSDHEQATLMLMLATNQADSVKYNQYVDDFIQAFPTATEGYNARATQLMAKGDLAGADDMLQTEVKRAEKKDEAYSNYATMVYRAVLYKVDTTYTKWNLDRAMDLAKEAEKVNPIPSYKHQQAQILYAQGNYTQSLAYLEALHQTNFRSNGEIYLEAAQCKTMLNVPKQEIMALLDSAVNAQSGASSAPYVLARGRAYDNNGEYRKAFLDYLTYDSLMNGRGSADFYFVKYKCENRIHQYQLALNDIAHAIVLNPSEPLYYAEMASLQLRVNQPDQAVKTCDLAFRLPNADEYSDLYIIKGIGLCETNHKEEGLENLKKAQEKGDTRAQALIEKYSKK